MTLDTGENACGGVGTSVPRFCVLAYDARLDGGRAVVENDGRHDGGWRERCLAVTGVGKMWIQSETGCYTFRPARTRCDQLIFILLFSVPNCVLPLRESGPIDTLRRRLCLPSSSERH